MERCKRRYLVWNRWKAINTFVDVDGILLKRKRESTRENRVHLNWELITLAFHPHIHTNGKLRKGWRRRAKKKREIFGIYSIQTIFNYAIVDRCTNMQPNQMHTGICGRMWVSRQRKSDFNKKRTNYKRHTHTIGSRLKKSLHWRMRFNGLNPYDWIECNWHIHTHSHTPIDTDRQSID